MGELFLTFLKIGLFTFGGGYAMIAQIKETVVSRLHWLTDDELVEVIAVAESTPGPIAINLATFVGYKRRGFWGSVSATLGVVMPSLLIIYAVSLFLDAFLGNVYVAYAFDGVKCAVAFLILKAGFEMLLKLKRRPLTLFLFGAVFASSVLLEILAVSFSSVFYIAAGGLVGVLVFSRRTSGEGKK